MDRLEAFRVLNIEQTKDEKLIKQAYRAILAVTNPEDDPEGFKRLRLAYDEACRYAAETDEAEGRQEPEDTTPSGLWLNGAKDIYRNIASRIDAAKWEGIFADDIFMSLEEEENCKTKLLIFLMDHYRLPSAVWKVLDKHMQLVASAAKLRESFPADYISFVVHQCENTSEFFFEDFSVSDSEDYDLFLGLYDQCIGALNEHRANEAGKILEQADETGISHPAMEIVRAMYYDECGNTAEAERLLQETADSYPERAVYQAQTGEYFWKRGEEYREISAKYFGRAKELEDKHYKANIRLAEYYFGCGRYVEAKRCAEKILAVGADDDFFVLLQNINTNLEKEYEHKWYEEKDWSSGLELSWCYLQDGRLSEGERIAKALRDGLPEDKEAEWKGLLAKYSLEECLYEQSAEQAAAWEEALVRRVSKEEDGVEKDRDIDRIRQSHMIRVQCYYQLGFKEESYFGKAIEEAESILLGGAKDINILMEMAQIYNEMGEYDKALDICDHLIQDYRVMAAHSIRLESGRRQLDAHMVIESGSVCLREFPEYEKAYEYMAKVYLDLEHPEHMKELLEIAEKNGVHSDLLDSYVFLQDHSQMDSAKLSEKCKAFREQYRAPLERGHMEKFEEGLPVITEYLHKSPETFMFVERGIFYRFASRFEEAERDLNKALSMNPTNIYALNALSFVHKYRGEIDKAICCLTKVILYKDDSFSDVVYSDMAELYCLAGDYEKALEFALLYGEKTGEKARWFYNQIKDIYIHLRDAKMACEYICKDRNAEDPDALEDCVDACLKCGEEALARTYLAKWGAKVGVKGLSGLVMDKFKNLLKDDKKGTDEDKTRDLIPYYTQYLWTELVLGSKKKAVECAEKLLQYSGAKPQEGKMADIIFACILCEEEKLGKKCAGILQKWLAAYEQNPVKSYHYRGKGFLQLQLLAGWYTESTETLQKLMEQAPSAELCHFCTSAVCRELESVRILLMLREGKRTEAEEFMNTCLRKQPADEFVQAIRKQIFEK